MVDDHKTNQLKLTLGLSQQGHTADTADNGRHALEMLRAHSYDLVLLDIVMPEMDGYQVLEQMKIDETLRNIPVIVISAQSEMESVVKGIELGAEDYLPKSFDPVLLRARIGACLEKKWFRDQEVEYLRQVDRLTDAAAALENDAFDPDTLTDVANRPDALGQLTRVFQKMALEFYIREQRLKQQVQALRIEVDKAKQDKQVDQITGTAYFQQLRRKAGDLREMLEGKDEKN